MKFTSALLLLFGIFMAINTTAQHRECATLHEWKQFKEMKESGSRAMNNPPVLPSEVILTTAHFEIHYTNTGIHAAPPLDADGNLTPDLIDTIVSIAELVYTSHASQGYMMPPPAPIGNDSFKYDIYVGNLGANTYGITVPWDDIGNNPASAETESHSTGSFLLLRNEYALFTPAADPSVDLSVTLAHEFSHAIDFSYNFFISYWLSESRAVFEESVVFPSLTDNYQYFPDILSSPDVALNLDETDNEAQNKNHFYGAWMFHQYMADHVDPDYLKPVLDASRPDNNTSYVREAVRINDYLVNNHETTLREQFSNFTIANYFFTGDNAYAPYTYAKGTAYRASYGGGAVVEGNRNFTGTTTVWNSVAWGNSVLMRLSADYVAVTANQNFSVRLDAEGKDSSYNMIVIKIDTGNHTFEFERTGWYHDSICVANIRDYADWDYFLVIVNRYDFYTQDTLSKQYEISIQAPLLFLNWWTPNTPFSSLTTTLAVDNGNTVWTNAGLSDYLYYQSGGGPYLAKGVTSFNGYFWHHHHYFNSTRDPNTVGFPGTTNDIDVAPDNHIWFGDANSGLYEYDHAIWKNYDDGDNNPGTTYGAFQVDAQTSNVWCAPRASYVYQLVGGVPTQQGSYAGNTTFVKFIGGKKYVGTDTHLYVDDGATAVYDTSDGLPNGYLTDAEVDHAGNLWVSSYGGGVAKFDGTTWETFDPWNPSGGYVTTRVMDIAVDANGIVWLAYENDGFGRYKNGTFIRYNYITAPEFPSHAVYSIDFDKKSGCLWMATDHGVVYYCDTSVAPTPVAIEELKNDFIELKLFPNPANDAVSIYAGGKLFAENTTVNVYNINGQLVKSLINTLNTNLLKMDVSDLMSGVYFVETKNARAKFVKM